MRVMRARCGVLAGLLASVIASIAAAGCKEEGGLITVHKLSFVGVKSVDEGRLKSALATRESSRIPWGRKAYFERSRFDADLKRIQACLLYTSPSPRDRQKSRMPSSA